MIWSFLILLILHSCNQETLPAIKVSSKEKTVQIVSDEYYIDSLELTNYFQKKPFYAIKLINEHNSFIKKINFQQPNKEYIVYGNFEFSCQQKHLELRGYLRSRKDLEKRLYFSIYFDCSSNTFIEVKPEGKI